MNKFFLLLLLSVMDVIEVTMIEKQGKKVPCHPQNRPPRALPAGVIWKYRSTGSFIFNDFALCLLSPPPHVCIDCSVIAGKKNHRALCPGNKDTVECVTEICTCHFWF